MLLVASTDIDAASTVAVVLQSALLKHESRILGHRTVINSVLGQTKRFLSGCENFLPALA